MKNKKEKLKNLGVFCIEDAKKLGISWSTLYRMYQKEEIIKLSRGLYIHPGCNNISIEERDFITSYKKFGNKSIIAGFTALFYHGLIEQVPSQIWITVPHNIKTTDSKYRLIRAKKISMIGVENKKYYKITNIERTLVESLRYSSKIGIRTSISAILKAINEKKTNLSKIMKMAKALGYENVIKKYWETIIGSIETNL
ncbi:MAG: hypothetical protein ABIA04_10095 [Pseudomonadota bacterium]